jgi:hypothetical protein
MGLRWAMGGGLGRGGIQDGVPRDVVEELVAILRDRKETIEGLRPCKVIAHLPPAGDERKPVVVEVNGKF